MSVRSRFVLALSFALLAAAFALSAFIPTSRVANAQVSTGAGVDRSTAQLRSPFFGDLTAKENDFFYNSLLTNYKERYVPSGSSAGHFRTAQKGGKSTLASPRSVPQTKTVPTSIAILKGEIKGDPSVDRVQQQRQTKPDVAQMVGPFSQDGDLRSLPYIPAREENDEVRLMRHRPEELLKNNALAPSTSDPLQPYKAPDVAPSMPAPAQTFAGLTSAQACGSCLPPDTDGDVGPNHYIQSVNSSIAIYSKTGTVLSGPTTYNSFFSAMGASTPCGANLNDGDGVVFYDHMADRWIVSDFAFSAFPGPGPFYQCIGVSKTSNPVSGGWWLYAVQVDPANSGYIGDYPKFGMWPDAYYMTVNLFSGLTTATETFNGVRVFAFNRAAMINGGPASTIAFSVLPADLGDQYSLVPASFRTGTPPPAGQPEWLLSVNSSATSGTVENQVFARRFHVDFVNPANSTFGVGASHAPDGIIGVAGFVDAFTTTTSIVPNGTATATQALDTLGDKLMYPLIYQNRGGVESLFADQSVNNNQNGTGPVSVRWYQFNVTGNSIPAAPVQQQTFNNTADGLWRWMPSLNVDNQGNLAVGYTTSSTTLNPEIRYAGRLATDPSNDLSQGEATLVTAGGHQTSTSGRWGDYSTMFVDPSDGCTFYHTNEYYTATSSAAWATRVGSFSFPGCTPPSQGTAHFSITNCNSAVAINGASVSIDGYPYGGTLSTGFFDAQFLAAGSHTYSVTKAGNSTATGNFTILNAQTTNVSACIASGTAHFIVTDAGTSQPLSGASVTVDGSALGTTDASGFFDTDASAGSHTYQVSKSGYSNGSGNFSITLGQVTNVPVALNGVATLSATKVADTAAVLAGQSIGYKVTISDTGTAAATGLGFSDPLPGGAGASWAIDNANSDAGWSITGAAPNQSLAYSGSTLAAGASKKVHVTSSTNSSCVAGVVLNNTATVTATNASQAQASASISVACAPVSAGPITVTASAGTPGPTDYPTLKAAFDAINAGTHQGSINVWVFGNTTETASASLSASGTGSSSYTSILIAASGGARTITGAIAAGSPLIDLNGADNVTINGANSGGTTLTLANTTASATAGTSTIRFINGATNNTVTNTIIQGSSSSSNTTAGGDVLFSTSSVGGNSNNTITKNDIGAAGANLPSKAIMGLGTAANVNAGNLIDNNDIHDTFAAAATNAAISIQGNNDAWTISNNRIFQTAPRTFTAAGLRFSGVILNNGSGAFTVTGNRIGFAASNGTGVMTISGSSNEIRGIDAPNTSTSVPTSIQGNVISGISQTSSRASTTTSASCFIGIVVGTTGGVFNIGDVAGNTVGSLDGSSSISIAETSTTASTTPVIGIYDFSFSNDTISNNNFGSIAISSGGTGTTVGFRGIIVSGTAGQAVVLNNNTIGGTAAGSISDTIVGSYAMYGIQIATANATLTGNVIRNFAGSSNGSAIVVAAGISTSGSTGANTFSQNRIFGLTNNSAGISNAVRGCQCGFGAASNVFERNFIHSLSITNGNATGDISGIVASTAAGTATYKNNFVRVGIDATGAAVPGGPVINGILEQGGTNNLYFNSVYVGGSGVTSAANTFALNSAVTTNARNYLDNIFFNARSNAAGAGKNYAISVGGTAPNPAGLTSNYNDLFVNGTGGVLGLFNATDAADLSAWQTATGQDANSLSVDPLFVNPTGTSLAAGGKGGLGDSSAVISYGNSLLSAPSAVVDLHV